MYPTMGETDRSAPTDTYYLRSKRRRKEQGEEVTCSHGRTEMLKRKNPIMHVPLEVLQQIFKFISNQELSEKVRKVNRRFKLAAEDLLNVTFKGLGKKVQHLTAFTFKAMEKSEDDTEVKCFCRLLNLLDIINFQQSVIMSTIWRYVYNNFYRTTHTCMYAGLILDLYEIFFQKFYQNPSYLYAPAVIKEYALPEEVKRIIALTKIFCIHFDKISEEPVKNSMLTPGCKIIDLLDCALYAERNVVSEQRTENSFSGRYNYYFRNAWFLAFAIPPEKNMPLRQKQRMMHMRMRRIVLSHTEMFMQQSHYEREFMIRKTDAIKEPSVVVYTGFGDVYDKFFCYGSMNDAAYFQKFHVQGDLDDDDDDPNFDEDDLEDEMNNPRPVNNIPENMDLETNDNESVFVIPHLGLDIDVRIDCPLAYAPARYVESHKDEFQNGDSRLRHGIFDLTIVFQCPGAYYTRLPTTYTFHKRISTRHVKKVLMFG